MLKVLWHQNSSATSLPANTCLTKGNKTRLGRLHSQPAVMGRAGVMKPPKTPCTTNRLRVGAFVFLCLLVSAVVLGATLLFLLLSRLLTSPLLSSPLYSTPCPMMSGFSVVRKCLLFFSVVQILCQNYSLCPVNQTYFSGG